MRENHIRQTEEQQHSLNLEKQVQQDRDHLKMTAFSSFLEIQDPRMLNPWYIPESCLRIGIVGVQGKERIQVGQLISSKLQDMMSKLPCTPCIQIYKGDIYLVWMYASRQSPISEAYISQIMDLLKIQTQIFGDLRCTLALGLEAADLGQLKASMLSARQALATRLVKGHGSVYEAQKVFAQHSASYVRRLDECFAQACAQNSSDTLIWCPQVFSEFEKNHEQPYTILESLCIATTHAIAFIKDHGNDDLAECDMESIEQAQSLEEAIQQFHTVFSKLHAAFLAMQETAIAKPIRIALEYISTHYQDELLSLESVSGIVQLNSSYFSALFKKSVGKGFADYIVDLRIRKAKELLVETNFSIANIALQIGYRDPKHFAKLFKKCCQIKPNEYRKLYG
ncbi:HTH-type transcriptional activator RhaR [bioreactor metagenome]|uniref:HTH-type transcriptional activator RhaR n=1 Tax=bioreactor metagenome TaxID=1076179 RepID=A0A645A8X1_9ZZZZ